MKVFNYATLADKNEQLKQVLNDALLDLKKADTDCAFCANNREDAPCDAADCDCSICTEKCVCKTCRDNSNWAWRVNVK